MAHENGNNKAEWIKLAQTASCGYFRHHFSCPVFLNSNEIMMACSNTDSNNDIVFGIYKYNVQSGVSELFMAYTKKEMTVIGTLPILKYDRKRRKIYIFTQNTATMIVIDIDNKTKQVINTEYDDACYMDGVVVKGQFHVLCKVNSLNYDSFLPFHLEWNNEANVFEEVHQFKIKNKEYRPRPYLHYLKSKRSLLALCNDGNLYLFDLNTRKWSKLILPFWMNIPIGYGAIVTSDDRYLIIIKRDIQVIDLNTMDVMKSSIKGPGSSSFWYYASSYHDHKDELLITGYSNQVNDIPVIPLDITDLIIRHYGSEWIYLFQQHDSLAPKWKILADEIISSCKILRKRRY